MRVVAFERRAEEKLSILITGRRYMNTSSRDRDGIFNSPIKRDDLHDEPRWEPGTGAIDIAVPVKKGPVTLWDSFGTIAKDRQPQRKERRAQHETKRLYSHDRSRIGGIQYANGSCHAASDKATTAPERKQEKRLHKKR
jgi:hypothetical protein